MGLPTGAWIGNFKKMLRENTGKSRRIKICNNIYNVRKLSEIARISKGQKISYVTDIAMSEKNIDKLT